MRGLYTATLCFVPFTVLKILRAEEDRVEVVGEFETRDAAREFAEAEHREDAANEFDYLVESPEPSSPEPNNDLVECSRAETASNVNRPSRLSKIINHPRGLRVSIQPRAQPGAGFRE